MSRDAYKDNKLLALTKENLAAFSNDASSATMVKPMLPASSTVSLAAPKKDDKSSTAGWGRNTNHSVTSSTHSVTAGWGRKTNPSVCSEVSETPPRILSKL